VLDDVRDLIRGEIALARAEMREELGAARAVAASFAGAVVAVAIAAVLLSITVASAIAYFLSWPAWTGYGIVTLVLLVAAFVLMRRGRSRMADIRALPKTMETMKENLAWMQNKSSAK